MLKTVYKVIDAGNLDKLEAAVMAEIENHQWYQYVGGPFYSPNTLEWYQAIEVQEVVK